LPIKAQGRESASAPWVAGSQCDLNPEGVTKGHNSPWVTPLGFRNDADSVYPRVRTQRATLGFARKPRWGFPSAILDEIKEFV